MQKPKGNFFSIINNLTFDLKQIIFKNFCSLTEQKIYLETHKKIYFKKLKINREHFVRMLDFKKQRTMDFIIG